MRALAVLLAVAVAVGVFFLMRPTGEAPAPEADTPEAGMSAAPGMAAARPAGLDPVRTGPTTRKPRNLPREPAVATYDTGSVAVRLAPEAGTAVSPGVRIAIEPLGVGFTHQPVFAPREDGLYAASGVPTGKHRVRVFSEGSVEASAEIEVAKDAETTVEVPLLAGGAASYAVTLLSGETPETVTLELYDARGTAIPAAYQTPATTLRISPEKPVAIPATGKVIGLRPGKYVLKARSAAGEVAEQAFQAKAGETTPLELQLRR